jgi:NitT/TauT family transport system substrate-binding protein
MRMRNTHSLPGRPLVLALVLALALAAFCTATTARAAETVRIGLPTKTYWPTIIAETALRQKLFEREGIHAELTIYRGGAECFEALAAGAADVILDAPSLAAAGAPKGVNSKLVAGGALGYYEWHLMVPTDSTIKDAAELNGKKVGITSAGSGSDLLALWTIADRKVKFTRVPLGGGGLVPNLVSHNVDAVVLYSPLTFQVMQSKEARSILDYGAAVPPHLNAGWIAPDKLIKEKPELVQKTINALYGGLAFLRANRDGAIRLITEIDEISAETAAAEYDNNILKLSVDGEMKPDWMDRALELAEMSGMTNLAPAGEIYVTTFRPVPTKP